MSTQEQHFQFLDALRKTGVVNMFGAAQYLEEAFDLSRADAKRALAAWMRAGGQNRNKATKEQQL